jgi:phage shock protein C
MDDLRQSFGRQGLIRPREGRILGGVIAGLGERFGLDPWPARLVFVLPLLIVSGSQILLYPLLWVLMPAQDAVATGPASPAPSAAA